MPINPITKQPYLGVPTLSPGQRATFLNDQAIRPEVLKAKTQLWRFNPLRFPRGISEYWMSETTMRQIMSIITSRGDFSNAAKREIVKENMAILDVWGKRRDRQLQKQQDEDIRNMAAWRLRIVLTHDVHAFIGQTGPMKDMQHNSAASQHYGGETTNIAQARMGGHEQVVIPEFAGKNEDGIKPFAYIDYQVKL